MLFRTDKSLKTSLPLQKTMYGVAVTKLNVGRFFAGATGGGKSTVDVAGKAVSGAVGRGNPHIFQKPSTKKGCWT